MNNGKKIWVVNFFSIKKMQHIDVHFLAENVTEAKKLFYEVYSKETEIFSINRKRFF